MAGGIIHPRRSAAPPYFDDPLFEVVYWRTGQSDSLQRCHHRPTPSLAKPLLSCCLSWQMSTRPAVVARLLSSFEPKCISGHVPRQMPVEYESHVT
jgi:hypothetical protein